MNRGELDRILSKAKNTPHAMVGIVVVVGELLLISTTLPIRKIL